MKRILTILAAVLISFISFAQTNARPPQPTGYKTVTGIPYHPGVSSYADERCILDVYYPEGVTDFPTVVWFHGGGIISGQREIPEALKNKGMAVIGVGYRFLTEVDVREVIDDAAAAVAWTFKNIASYGGSTSKIFVSGHSAGGYLTDMVVLDKSYLEKYGVDADDIAGAFPFSAQVVTHYNVRKPMGIDELHPIIDETAPLRQMRKLDMPFFVMSGDRELEMYGRYEEQAYFWRMMKLIGNEKCYLYEFDGFDHGSMPTPAFPVMVRQIRSIVAGRPYSR